MTAYIGIDPGQTGGLVLIRGNGDLTECLPMPSLDGEVDANRLHEILYSWANTAEGAKVAIEQVHSMPGQGVSTTFKFGKNFGIALGVIACVGKPMVRITPQTWKKQFVLTGKGKDASRHKATELWPHMKDHWKFKYQNGISDAALIAECARRQGL